MLYARGVLTCSKFHLQRVLHSVRMRSQLFSHVSICCNTSLVWWLSEGAGRAADVVAIMSAKTITTKHPMNQMMRSRQIIIEHLLGSVLTDVVYHLPHRAQQGICKHANTETGQRGSEDSLAAVSYRNTARYELRLLRSLTEYACMHTSWVLADTKGKYHMAILRFTITGVHYCCS